MSSIEIILVVRDESDQVRADVRKKISKQELFLNNVGPMNFGTITFKEMFKKLLKTEEILAK